MTTPFNINNLVSNAKRLTCFGWTSRNDAIRNQHIAELAAHGIAAPSHTPIMIELSPYLLTTDPEIGVVNGTTSGEIEYVLVQNGNDTWVTVGSDHTDREIERVSIPVSKQACAKCLATEAWLLTEIIEHWDELILQSWVFVGESRSVYQQGKLSEILRPEVLLGHISQPAAPGLFVFSGTLPTLGGIVYGHSFEVEIVDPVLVRKITHKYRVRVMPQIL